MLETLYRHLPMVRLTVTASLLAMIGCTGLIDAPEPTKAEIARQLWIEKALPALKSVEATCTVCHAGARPNVEFLGGATDLEIRTTVLAFDPPVLSLDAPGSSRLLNKGQHEGPPLIGQQKSDVLEWITAEKEAATVGPDGKPAQLGLRTADYTMSLCNGLTTCPLNEIALDDLGEGAGVPGARITFFAHGVENGLYLTNVRLVPGAQGAYIEHPLFVSIPTDPKENFIADEWDRLNNERRNLMPNATGDQQFIGGGTLAFANFKPDNKIAVFFKAAQAFKPDGGGGMVGGCKAPTQFEAVRTQFANCGAAGCHGGEQNATSALDMRGIGAAGTAMNACNQIRLRATLNNIPQSGIFLTPRPGNADHPFQFAQAAHTAFINAVTPWLVAERDAP